MIQVECREKGLNFILSLSWAAHFHEFRISRVPFSILQFALAHFWPAYVQFLVAPPQYVRRSKVQVLLN